jgi:hypothetical protein
MLVICSYYKECTKTREACDWKSTQFPECHRIDVDRFPLAFNCGLQDKRVHLIEWEEEKDE